MKNRYSENWPEIGEQVKREAGYKCKVCGHANDRESGYVLTVHHLDRNPENNERWNLLAACQRCHLRLEAQAKILENLGTSVFEDSWLAYNARRGVEYAEWFKPYLEGFWRARQSEVVG